MSDSLASLANIAAIITAAVALFGYLAYQIGQCRKRIKLEQYLRSEKQQGSDNGQRSLLHLVANVGMTETELIQASFKSKRIIRRIKQDKNSGLADSILLEFKD